MKVIVTSDAHGNNEKLKKIAYENPDADLYLDAGDSCLRLYEIEPFLSVRGNCDFHIKNNQRVDKVGDISIYTTHGNGLFFNDNALSQKAKEYACQIAVHGHTHVPKVTICNGIYILCPGSVSNPRSLYGKTYAIITFTSINDIDMRIIKI